MGIRVITVSRQFGSGGRTIAKETAERLGWAYYDKELVKKIAAESGLAESYILESGEYACSTSSFLFNWVMNAESARSGSLPISDQLYIIQHNLIKDLAEKERCVIVGRCADYLLRERDNVIRCYIFAPYQARIVRSIHTLGCTAAEPQRIIEEVDKARAEYYRTHTGCEVNNTRYRDIFLNSNLLGIEGSAKLLVEAARHKFHLPETTEK